MTPTLITPGQVLGVLGGGQLGAMFAGAARRLGYRIAVWDPDPDAPAHRLATHSFSCSFTDPSALDEFTQRARAVTYEWENVPAALCRQLELRVSVRPSSRVLGIIQDRIEQKTFLAALGCPVPRFVALARVEQLPAAVADIGYPALCKTATSGYDGKGQWKILREADVPGVQRAILESARTGVRWIVESLVPFERELSLLVARGLDGQTVTYPVVENTHEEGILRTSVVPASIPDPVREAAGQLARRVVEGLEGIGIFCLELFHLPGGELLINEVAPRPHNSGHYTLDACSVSQFEQQVRAICGLPLGETRLLSPAAMVNIIGEEWHRVAGAEGCRSLMQMPGAVLHHYGKQIVRPRRKLGHVTFLADDAMTARNRAAQFTAALRVR